MLHRLARSPSAERQRKARQRRKVEAQANRERVRRAAERRDRGVACYMVEIGADVLDMLVRLGWLADAVATDRRQVERALAAMLADAARR